MRKQSPHFTVFHGTVQLEWWNGNKKVTASAPASVFDALIITGPNMQTDMEDTNLEYALDWLYRDSSPEVKN